jgi:hypothetical protein
LEELADMINESAINALRNIDNIEIEELHSNTLKNMDFKNLTFDLRYSLNSFTNQEGDVISPKTGYYFYQSFVKLAEYENNKLDKNNRGY